MGAPSTLSSLPWKLYHNPQFSSSSFHDSSHQKHVNHLELNQIDHLISDLELERRLRQHAESITQSLSLELAEARRLRAEAEAEAARCRDAADRAAQEAEEERRMMKYADALREERVQMKFADAAIVLEEKMRKVARVGRKGRQGRENMQIKKGVKGSEESMKTAGKNKELADRTLECHKSLLRVLVRQKNGGDLRVVADSHSLVVQ